MSSDFAYDNKPQRHCPDDQTPLVKVTDRKSGVITDDCPRCGIQVLDRGELPAIIQAVVSVPGFRPMQSQGHGHGSHGSHGYGHGGHSHTRHHGSGGFSEIFFGSS